MATKRTEFWATEEVSFSILRALTMLGGMVALFLIPLRPEHQPHLPLLAWTFVAYKALLFLAIRAWPARLHPLLLSTVAVDLLFVSLFVWFSGGIESHFYLLFYLLVALAAFYFGPGIALATSGAAGALYSLASAVGPPSADWHYLSARVATLFLLGGSLGYLSQRERLARARVEDLNRALEDKQVRLERAYRDVQTAQDRLVQSERLATIGRMAAKISHEVRNPLGSISLNAELLEDELRGVPEEQRTEARNLLAAIRSQVDVLSAVTEEYLRFARLPRPKLETTELTPVIEDLVDFVRGELQARGVQIVTTLPERSPSLELDPGQIRQALLNLIRNAAEAMPQGGTITLCTRQMSNGGSVDQRTGEPGQPNPPIHQSTRGRRVGRSERDRYRCGDSAREPGQHLRALLHHQGWGNRSWPRHRAADHGRSRRDPDLRERAGGRHHVSFAPPAPRWMAGPMTRVDAGIRVPVVDDGQAVREALFRAFTKLGCQQVVLAKDGQAGLDCLRQRGIHIILGDLKLPKLSGQDLFNAARAISPAVEVIVITGQGTVEDAVEVMKEGACDSITKRFRWVQLEVTIRKAAEKQALALQDRVPKCRVEEL